MFVILKLVMTESDIHTALQIEKKNCLCQHSYIQVEFNSTDTTTQALITADSTYAITSMYS